jgi:hypothetical protein
MTWDEMQALDREKLLANPPIQKVLVIMGDRTPQHPALRDVPAAETLAKNDADRQLLKTIQAPSDITKPYSMAPEVPRERVEAMRLAFSDALNDRELLAEAQRVNLEVSPRTGEEVTRMVESILTTPAAVVERLKTVMK